MAKPWKTIRCVVEVPVQVQDGQSFTEKDLSWAVSRALSFDVFWQDRKYLPKPLQPIFGQVRVKEYNRAMVARDRKNNA